MRESTGAHDLEDDEDAIAAQAVIAWSEVEGYSELAMAAREALVLIAQEALARKAAREEREARTARREQAARDAARRRALAERQGAPRSARALHPDMGLAPADPRADRPVDRSPGAVSAPVPSASGTTPPAMARVHPVGRAPILPPVGARHAPLAEPDKALGVVLSEPRASEAQGDSPSEPAAGSEVPPAPVAHPATVRTVGPPSPTGALTGTCLRAWRTAHGLTQDAAADRLGVRQGTVSKAERRGDAPLGPALRDALADALKGPLPKGIFR